MSEGRDAQYDPYIPSGGNNAGAGAPGNQRTAALQAVSTIFLILAVTDRGP